MRALTGLTLALALAAGTVSAQQPPAGTPTPAPAAPTAQPAAPQAQPAPATPQAPPPVAYTYNPSGRRDPFVSLAGRGADGKTVANRPSGLPGVLIDELTIKGIVRDQQGFFALIQGGDSKVYTVRAGDRLMDGTVKSITADAVVFSQEVNDPLIVQKQREIRKSLRPGEGSRG